MPTTADILAAIHAEMLDAATSAEGDPEDSLPQETQRYLEALAELAKDPESLIERVRLSTVRLADDANPWQPFIGERGANAWRNAETEALADEEGETVQLADAPDLWQPYLGKQGARKGQSGWKHGTSGRVVWGAKPTPRGAKPAEAAPAEGTQAAKPTEKPAVKKRAAPAAKGERPTLEAMASRFEELKDPAKVTPESIKEVTDQLMSMTVKDLGELKKRLGVKASGAKSALAKKIIELALGEKPTPKANVQVDEPIVTPKVKATPKPKEDKMETQRQPHEIVSAPKIGDRLQSNILGISDTVRTSKGWERTMDSGQTFPVSDAQVAKDLEAGKFKGGAEKKVSPARLATDKIMAWSGSDNPNVSNDNIFNAVREQYPNVTMPKFKEFLMDAWRNRALEMHVINEPEAINRPSWREATIEHNNKLYAIARPKDPAKLQAMLEKHFGEAALEKPVATTVSSVREFRSILNDINSGKVNNQRIDEAAAKMQTMGKPELEQVMKELNIGGKPKSRIDAVRKIKQVLDTQYEMYLRTHTTLESKPVADSPAKQATAAMLGLVKQLGGKSNLASLADVRDSLEAKGMNRAQQDHVIVEAMKQGLVSGVAHEGRGGISERDQAAGLRMKDEPHPIGFLSAKPNGETSPAKHTAESRSASLAKLMDEANNLEPGSSHEHISKGIDKALEGISHDDARKVLTSLLEQGGDKEDAGRIAAYLSKTKKRALEEIRKRILEVKVAKESVQY